MLTPRMTAGVPISRRARVQHGAVAAQADDELGAAKARRVFLVVGDPGLAAQRQDVVTQLNGQLATADQAAGCK